MAHNRAGDLYRHYILAYVATESSKSDLTKYANAVFEVAGNGYPISKYDEMKNDFIGMIDEPRLTVQSDTVGSGQPAFQMMKQYVDRNTEPQNPYVNNEVLCNQWDENIPTDDMAPDAGTCSKFIHDVHCDNKLRGERPDVANNMAKLEAASDFALNIINAVDLNGFPKTTFEQALFHENVAENINKKSNQLIRDEINDLMVESLNESQMDAYNRAILYFPFVENSRDKIQVLMNSPECKYHNEAAVAAAVMIYESMKDGVISYTDAEYLLRVVNEATFNEFSIGQMAPLCGMQYSTSNKLRNTPIEKVIAKTNAEIDKEDKIADAVNEEAFSFLEYVIEAYNSGAVDADLTGAYKEIFYEGLFGGNYDYEDWDTGKIKEKMEESKKNLEIYKKFDSEMTSEANKVVNSVMKDYNAYRNSGAKEQLKTRLKNTTSKIIGKEKINLDTKKLQAEADNKCEERWVELRKSYLSKYGLEIKTGRPSVRIDPGDGKVSISVIVDEQYKTEKEIKHMEEEMNRRGHRSSDNHPDDGGPSKQKGGNIVSIDDYKKNRGNKRIDRKKLPVKGNTALKEAVDVIGFALVEGGVELGSPMMELYEACYDLESDYAGREYLEATKVDEKPNGIFEFNAKKIFDKIRSKLTLPKDKKPDKQFEASLSADKTKATFYMKSDKFTDKELTQYLINMGYTQTKKSPDQLVFIKEDKGYEVRVKIDTKSGSMLIDYLTPKYRNEKPVTEAADIDEDIKPILDVLNKKGYITKYSCSGHPASRIKEDKNKDGVYNAKIYTTARITFAKKYDFPSYPDRWRVSEKDGKISIYAKPYTWNEKQGNPDAAWKKWKASYMATLASWANSLPNEGEKQSNEAPTTENMLESMIDEFVQLF